MITPYVLMALVGLLLTVAILIVIGTIQTGISPMPSSNKAYQSMKDMLDLSEAEHILDLGSGWGNIVIRLAKDFPDKQIHGYELSWLPWAVSSLLKHLLKRNNLTLHRANFLTASWPNHCTLVCYLFPNVMKAIEQKIEHNQAAIDCVVCNNFMLPNHQPIKTVQLTDFYRSPVYLYRIGNKP